MGQSNMAGRGDFGEVPVIDDARILMLRNGHWIRMSEPINPDRSVFGEFHSGIGLAASFAEEFIRFYNGTIGLIPCADGGACLDDWMPGGALYDHAVFQTRMAMRSSTVSGILFHQGEADARAATVSSYEEKFEKINIALRRDTGLEQVPMILGELGYFIAASTRWGKELPVYFREINLALHRITAKHDRFAIASAKGLTAKPDEIHFNSASCREFGRRYFQKYRELCFLMPTADFLPVPLKADE
jgi:hypothetical protein